LIQSALRDPGGALAELDADGFAWLRGLIGSDDCDRLSGLYEHDELFRKRIAMEQHGYGRGEYKYFAYPLPEPIAKLRSALYAMLAPIANRWCRALGIEREFPQELQSFLEICHRSGQLRPTPLMLEYRSGDYNRLHQDLYGDWVFPLQVVIQLSSPDQDFSGGELVLTEQRPRMQSRPIVLTPARGDAVVFPSRERPVASQRGFHRVQMRHGVSRVHSGHRRTLGLIFHDAS